MYRIVWLSERPKAQRSHGKIWHATRELAEGWAAYFTGLGHRVGIQSITDIRGAQRTKAST